MKYTIWLMFLLSVLPNKPQPFSPEERVQGYAVNGEQVFFVFDPDQYGVSPERVVVTGAFRAWDQEMEDPNWNLTFSDGVWQLKKDKTELGPGVPFKFRINEGEWMDPPTKAVNRAGGNLVLLPDAPRESFTAELRNEKVIWANIIGDRPLNKSAYRLKDAQGNAIPIANVLPNTSSQTLIATSEPLDMARVYFLEIPAQGLKTACSFESWFQTLYSDKPLGANLVGDRTIVRIFAPRAKKVQVYLYRGRGDSTPFRTADLIKDEQGVWEFIFGENLHGIYYDFTVHGVPDPGNHFYETQPIHITDPYARVSDNTWGKARIWEKTTPAQPLANGIPAMEDVIAYEVHVQDFTDQLPVAPELKGTFTAMVTPGLTNRKGEKIGFDYLLELGINTVHLMPVQEYLHYPDEDWRASFEDDPYMISQGVNEENYQWGYRTSHAFAVESKYRTQGMEPGSEREEFRDLVQAFHDQNIAVIIDIVPNHTAENMDGNEWFFNFNVLDKLYYYRTKDFKHIGAYGNEVKTENRPMVQRWLIDQCKHFIEEFGIDGFRIDLAGQIDQQTLKALREAIGEDKIVYGEAWIGSNDPNYEANPDWDWYKEDSPITFFQDDARNAFKGPVFELKDKQKDRGWPGGNFGERDKVMLGLLNGFPEEKTPLSGINYLDIHDNFALADQFGTNDFDGRLGVDENLYKIATTLLFTSLGPIVLHGGSEIMRSKGAAPLEEVLKETVTGYKIYMHGKRDTYNHRLANQFVWEQVGQRPSRSSPNNYRDMHAFWKGMIAFRNSEYGRLFRLADAAPEGYYQWITPPRDPALLGYIVNGQICVLLNAGNVVAAFQDIPLPEGNWKLIANVEEVNMEEGVRDEREVMTLIGGNEPDVIMPAESLYIWVRESGEEEGQK